MCPFTYFVRAVPGANGSLRRVRLRSTYATLVAQRSYNSWSSGSSDDWRVSEDGRSPSMNRRRSVNVLNRNSCRSNSSSAGDMESREQPISSSTNQRPLPQPQDGTRAQPTVRNTVTGCLDYLPDPSAGPLNWYSCGPTVYDDAHLGHARTYVCLDIIRRVLTDYFRYDVVYALGITDVDDKIIARAHERGLTEWLDVSAMAGDFEKEFMEDMAELGVRRPDAVTRVTDHVPDIIAYIESIMENGMAYEAEGGVYFDVERMGDDYGALGVRAASSTTPDEAGGSNLRGKRSHKDFALWKRVKPGEPWWESPFGPGRPGWHIECSAMTHSLFGPRLDVHSGGVDLKFPHHTNEIAQCEAHGCRRAHPAAMEGSGEGAKNGSTDRDSNGTSEPWVKHWIHTGHLHIEGLKMSKSLKNFVTVRQYLAECPTGREAAAEDFRMFCLMHKYNSTVMFSKDRMEEARVVRERFQRFFALAKYSIGAEHRRMKGAPVVAGRWSEKEKSLAEETSTCRRKVRHALSDDFDTPTAVRHLAALCSLISSHLNDTSGREDFGPIISSAKYAAETLALLGVRSSSNLTDEVGLFEAGSEGAGRGKEGVASAIGLQPAEKVVSEMVEFRRLVRKCVLEHDLKRDINSATLMKRNLLQLVDDTRDRVLPSLGVRVEDTADKQCTWMVLPPDRRSSNKGTRDSSRQDGAPPSSSPSTRSGDNGGGP